MKTTIDIPPPVLKMAKKYARERNLTLKNLVEIGLVQLITNKNKSKPNFELKDVSVSGHGLQSGLDWDSWQKIREMSYEESTFRP